MPTATAKRTALYRLYDANGVLLYIGISGDPKRRFRQHARTKHWWPEVVRKEEVWFDTRREAEDAAPPLSAIPAVRDRLAVLLRPPAADPAAPVARTRRQAA